MTFCNLRQSLTSDDTLLSENHKIIDPSLYDRYIKDVWMNSCLTSHLLEAIILTKTKFWVELLHCFFSHYGQSECGNMTFSWEVLCSKRLKRPFNNASKYQKVHPCESNPLCFKESLWQTVTSSMQNLWIYSALT